MAPSSGAGCFGRRRRPPWRAEFTGELRAGGLHVYLADGQLLAKPGSGRLAALPDVPSFTELGYRNFNPLIWQGFFLPVGTPPEIVAKLGRAIHDGVRRPEVAQKIRDWGFEPVGSLPEEFQARLREEDAIWGSVAAATGIRAGQ
jgi:tripartite-type tricarboxylate transporter receptor subunit TctC